MAAVGSCSDTTRTFSYDPLPIPGAVLQIEHRIARCRADVHHRATGHPEGKKVNPTKKIPRFVHDFRAALLPPGQAKHRVHPLAQMTAAQAPLFWRELISWHRFKLLAAHIRAHQAVPKWDASGVCRKVFAARCADRNGTDRVAS